MSVLIHVLLAGCAVLALTNLPLGPRASRQTNKRAWLRYRQTESPARSIKEEQ